MRYFKQTVTGFLEKAHARDHRFEFSCSAEIEDVPKDLASDFLAFCGANRILLQWRLTKPNLGANMNAALLLALMNDPNAAGRPEAVILLQDDWLLTEPADFTTYANFLDFNSDYALVRFGWPEIPDPRDERAAWIQKGGEITWAQREAGDHPIIFLDPASTFAYGDQPHMRRGTFPAEYGWFKEGGDTGEPEVELKGRLARERWNIALSHKVLFHHIGEHTSLRSEAERFGSGG